ncbi:MAG: fibronectin type III domain-containing protein [Lachnospiraceae bacterium]|nr:fibronectin type III domain-containing protein [Lachnospiraceae bacterium]
MCQKTKRLSYLKSVKLLALFGVLLGLFSIGMEVHAEYQKFPESKAPISTMSVYKNMDTTFLKTYPFGTTTGQSATIELETAQDMIKATDIRLKAGRYVRTEGFYSVGDGGAGTYVLSTTPATGGILLENGLYANLIADKKVIDGKTWAIVSVKQLGAKGDGQEGEQDIVNSAISLGSEFANNNNSIFRSIVYLPKGEYRCTNQVQINVSNVNFVGDGEDSVFFTDNDYRKDIGYYEFFFTVWGATDLYMADFKVEAREVDHYKYMRQMVFVDCSNVYTYRVDLNIPQETFSKDYYVDKQYSSLTYYSGNRNMTLDDCKLELMSSTFRGANLGVLDFYGRGEENITIMNCEFHSDARDEQIGIFSARPTYENYAGSFVRNIYFINNTMYSYQPLDQNAAGGWRTMCFTVAYDESKEIENVIISGNHFIADLDSKFMTFGGGLQSCEVSHNMIEARCTANNGAFLFDSSNGHNERIQIQDNEFYITYRDNEGTGKFAILSGHGTVKGNKIVSDTFLYRIGYVNGVYENNTYINFGNLKQLTEGIKEFNNNKIVNYNQLGTDNLGQLVNYYADSEDDVVNFTGNEIIDYKLAYEKKDWWHYLVDLRNQFSEFNFVGNKYIIPNKYFYAYSTATLSNDVCPIPAIMFRGSSINKVNFKNNTLQGLTNYTTYEGTTVNENGAQSLEQVTKEDSSKEEGLQGETQTDNIERESNRIPVETERAVSENTISENAIADDGVVNREAATEQKADSVTETEETESILADTADSDKVVNLYLEGNTYPSYTYNANDTVCTEVQITQNGKATTEIYTSASAVSLGTIVKAGYLNAEGTCENPAVVTNKTLHWHVSLDGLASVNNGVVTRKEYGDVVVFAAPIDGSQVYGKCTIHFVKGFATGIQVEKDKVTLQTSKKYKVVYDVLPADSASQTVKWTSSNEAVATVTSQGIIEAVSVGTATITCATQDGTNVTKTIQVTVEPLTVKKITLNYIDWYDFEYEQNNNWENKGIGIGETLQLQVRYYTPDDAVNKTVGRWESTNEEVATVDQNGLVTTVGQGTCGIRAYTTDGKYYGNCNVWVQPAQIPSKDIRYDHSNTSITLYWKTQKNVHGYNLYCDKGDGKGYEKVKDLVINTQGDESYYNAYGLTAGKTYKYKIAPQITRWDSNGFSHTYETLSEEISITTYSSSVITNFNTNGVESIGVSLGGSTEFCVYANKNIIDFQAEDEDIISLTEIDDAINAKRKVTGLKEGFTYITVTAKDEKEFSKKYPVLVYDFQKIGNNIEAEGLIKSARFKWKVENKDRQNGFRLKYKYGGKTCEEFIEMDKLSLSVDQNGDTYATYVLGGLENDYDYSFSLAPYLIRDGLTFTGADSNSVSIHTPAYTNVDSITGENTHLINKGATKKITVTVGPTGASEPNVVWIPYRATIIQVTESGTVSGQVKYAVVKGIKAGISKLNAVAADENNFQMTMKVVVLPLKVTNVTATTAMNSVSIKWTGDSDAAGYTVYRYHDTSKTWVNIATTSQTSYVDSGLSADTVYQYKIGVYIKDNEGIYEGQQTEVFTFRTQVDPNAQVELPFNERKVANFKISKNYTKKVKLSWTKMKDAQGYQIYQYKSKKWKKVSTLKKGTTKTKVIKKLKPGTTYKFRIRAYKKENGKTIYTKYTNLKVMTRPSKVKIKSTTAGTKKLTLKWKKVKASGYEVQYCTSKKFKKNVKKVTVKKSKTKATIKKLKSGKTYYVRIRAYSKVNGKKYYGAYSTVKKVKIK